MYYVKPLYDAVSGLTHRSPSWIYRVGAGTHSGDGSFILPLVSNGIDKFILEYLRVNESACAP